MDDLQEIAVEREKRRNLPLYITGGVFAALFLGGFIFALLNAVHKVYAAAQATLVILGNLIGLLALAAPFLLKHVFGVYVADSLVYFWWVFAFCHCTLGETCMLYYYLVDWDKVLHCLAGALIFYTVFALARCYFAKKELEKSYFVSVLFAVAASLAIACLWEIYEFTVDSLFGTNMQKIIPTHGEMFNGGSTFADLNGTVEEIGEFYRSPSGYRFALVDTVTDCIVLLVGTVAGVLVSIPLYRKRPHFLQNAFHVAPKEKRRTASDRAGEQVEEEP